MNETFRQRRALYNKGMSDAEISRRQGVDPSTICLWRKKNGLAAHPVKPKPHDHVTPVRRLLHELGWNIKSIAKVQGVTPDSVKQWRSRYGLSPNTPKKRVTDAERRQQLGDLQRRVVKAVGCRLPFDIAADAAAELMLAVIEGTVPLDQIEKQGRSFGNRALREYANPFTTRSLDEERADHEGLRQVDMLVDPSSSAWLEEMGATVH